MPVRKLPSGRWQAQYLHPHKKRTETGGRNYITAPVTFRTKTDAKLWLDGIRIDIARGTWRSAEQIHAEQVHAEREAVEAARTFGDYATDWMASRPLTPATRRSYGMYLNGHLLPRWGDTPLVDITTADIRQWLAVMAPGRPGARRKAYELFRTILNTAVDDDALTISPCKRNMLGTTTPAPPAKGQKPHRKQRRRALTLHELEALANAAPTHMRVLIMLMGLTGMRAGEARFLHGCSHTAADGRAWLHIEEAVTGAGKDLAIGPPKTPKSVRSIPVPRSLLDDVAALAAVAGPSGLLFPKPGSAEIIPYATFYDNVVAAGDRAGIGHVTPHDLRHTAVSLAREHGAPDTAVRDLVGHTTTSMTARYTHTTPDALEKLVDGVDASRALPTDVADLETWKRRANG